MSRTTTLDIELQLRELNNCLGRPDKPYERTDGRLIGQVGNIHLYHDFNGYKIFEMCNEAGAVRDVTYKRFKTKGDVSAWLDGAIFVARERLKGLI